MKSGKLTEDSFRIKPDQGFLHRPVVVFYFGQDLPAFTSLNFDLPSTWPRLNLIEIQVWRFIININTRRPLSLLILASPVAFPAH
jgi:hypothetical protein